MTNILLHYALEDKRKADKIASHLQTPVLKISSYHKDILGGDLIKKRKAEITQEADAVLVLASVDFIGNSQLMEEMSWIMQQRPDIIASRRIFVLFIRPIMWYANVGAIRILNGGNCPESERQIIRALAEMVQCLADGNDALARSTHSETHKEEPA